MKKRIEKVVECIYDNPCLTIGKKYKVLSETSDYYILMDDEGDVESYNKENFKVVSEREVLEFEGFNLDKWHEVEYTLEITSDIDLTNYNLKVIATPKVSPYEGKSREELIEIIIELIKLLKSKE